MKPSNINREASKPRYDIHSRLATQPRSRSNGDAHVARSSLSRIAPMLRYVPNNAARLLGYAVTPALWLT